MAGVDDACGRDRDRLRPRQEVLIPPKEAAGLQQYLAHEKTPPP